MKPSTIQEYLDSFSGQQKAKLVELHQIIRAVLPGTREELKWGAPATLDADGMILVIFSGHKQHMNLVATPTTKQAFEKELAGYETGAGSIKLVYDKPLPTELIRKIVLYRAQEYRQNGVKWK